jgi:uncharacterized protein (DUF2235 family)
MAVKDDTQLAYYDPGVGTMGARSAATRVGKAITQVAGLVFGHGIKDNIEEAYHWLMENFEAGDRIFIVGFSRGAYTSLALAGMLRTVGLLRPGAHNLVPYALKLYAQHGKERPTKADDAKFWGVRDHFNTQFGNPEFPNRFAPQVTFLGLWDTVKSVGWLNARARFEQAQWPFTRVVTNVVNGRLALAIDENRRPYGEYRFDPNEVAKRPGLREVWFAGVHSDVGGQFPDDHKLSDIALGWMADEAVAAGLRVDEPTYQKLVGVPPGTPLPPAYPLGKIHTNSLWWAVAGFGWHHRTIRQDDHVHPSVRQRIKDTANSRHPYRPSIGRSP